MKAFIDDRWRDIETIHDRIPSTLITRIKQWAATATPSQRCVKSYNRDKKL